MIIFFYGAIYYTLYFHGEGKLSDNITF